MNRMVDLVLKFGGTSVGSPDSIRRVMDILQAELGRGRSLAVIVSAFTGVTDGLIAAGNAAAGGDERFRRIVADLEARHLAAVEALVGRKNRDNAAAQVKLRIYELKDLLQGVFLLRELSKRTLDTIMSFGERLSAFVIAEALRDRGVDAQFLDARPLVVTDAAFGCATVRFEETDRRIRECWAAPDGAARPLPVITGFIAATAEGETTTLGRGGSDYTAAIFGAALAAAEVHIYTDVDGIYTADPRKVRKTFPLAALSFVETMELSHFGAKVIYPPTLAPVMGRDIPILIRNTFRPDFAGTRITHAPGERAGFMISGISSIENIALLRLEGSGMVGIAGIAARLFGSLARGGISVIMITQGSSEHTICLAVVPEAAPLAVRLIEAEFALEIETRRVERVVCETELSIVAIIGENMRKTAGISGRLFGALGKNGINVAAIAQGSSECNISIVISRRDEVKALNALHDAFFLSKVKTLNVYLAGTGVIGRTLLDQFARNLDRLRAGRNLEIRVAGLANSRRMLCDPDGLDPARFAELLEARGEPADFGRFVDRIRADNLPFSILVDCTASEAVPDAYEPLLRSRVSIVTPNKKGLSGPLERYRALRRIGGELPVKLLYETTVGAGLPVIGTLQDLIASGDRVLRIDAIVSGTLSFIFHALQGGRAFSEAVAEAQRRGFTEPDPRDDLNGLDVARKLIILARECGLDLELPDVAIEPLIGPECLAAKGVDEFFLRVKELDARYGDRVAKATAAGEVLRYVATIEDGAAGVRLAPVGPLHPFFSLLPGDNVISFTTERYRERPLVIKGPGAGAEVTAAGVFADILRVSNYLM